MKVKLLAVLLLAAVGAIGITATTSKNTAKGTEKWLSKKAVSVPEATASAEQRSLGDAKDPQGTIDGAITPDKIPDHVAYMMLFRSISDYQTEDEKKDIQAYIKQAPLGGLKCKGDRPSKKGENADVDALMDVAGEFRQRADVINDQAREIWLRSGPNPSPAAWAQLTELQRQKESMIADLAGSLSKRLSVTGLESVRNHIDEYVKRGIKYTPPLATRPTGHPVEHLQRAQ